MNRLIISLLVLGPLPTNFSLKKLRNWGSNLFEIRIVNGGEIIPVTENAAGDGWTFTDQQLNSLTNNNNAVNHPDLIIVLTKVPLECDWFTRRLGDKKAVITFKDARELMQDRGIPLENYALRMIYALALLYRSIAEENRLPTYDEAEYFVHHATSACIFDFAGIKSDIVDSCEHPGLCGTCIRGLGTDQGIEWLTTQAKKELRRIKKPLYYRIMDLIKAHPVWSLVLSIISALILGIASSFCSELLYVVIRR